MATRPDLADLLTQVSREIHSRDDLDSTLVAVAGCLRASLPDGHHVGVSVLRGRERLEPGAASDDLARELDDLQAILEQGPSLHALAVERVVAVPRLHDEQRWERYVPLAVERGVRAQLAVRLGDERVWGAISVYSTGTDVVCPSVERLTTLVAQHAALAVEHASREDNLKTALHTRRLIGQAVGLAMERFGLDEEMAFRYLVRLSSNSNVKLREIARELVDQANDQAHARA